MLVILLQKTMEMVNKELHEDLLRRTSEWDKTVGKLLEQQDNNNILQVLTSALYSYVKALPYYVNFASCFVCLVKNKAQGAWP